MASYDSDSSDDDNEYTSTNVLLGYAAAEPSGDAISHLGGTPAWIDDKTRPSGALAKCKVCNDHLTLLIELHGDLPEHFPGHDRRLYIWACRRKTCRRKEGTVRGIRGVRIAKGASNKTTSKAIEQVTPGENSKPQPMMGESLFGVQLHNQAPMNPFSTTPSNANPFATSKTAIKVTCEDTNEAPGTLPETFASKLRFSSPNTPPAPPTVDEPWPSESSFSPPYPNYYLDAEYETLDTPSAPDIPQNARMDLDADSGGGGGKEDKEVFESSIDKTFQKFADRIGENAEQVLRYEYKGKPLLYSSNDATGKALAQHSENSSSSSAKVTAVSNGRAGFPRCQICGADRTFELQLTPHAITELEANETTIDGMEWGTIILAVCSKDCKPSHVSEGEVAYVEEWIGVQWEEIASKK